MPNFVQLALEKKAADFQSELEAVMADKIAAALEAKKQEIAASMFKEENITEKIGPIKHGAFHAWLGKPEDEPITDADIEKGLKAGGHAAKMAEFAKAERGWNHK